MGVSNNTFLHLNKWARRINNNNLIDRGLEEGIRLEEAGSTESHTYPFRVKNSSLSIRPRWPSGLSHESSGCCGLPGQPALRQISAASRSGTSH
ncbi:hypothetical protein AVEN_16571-1 [Araneus ventricosus]|uniref:Uncharacterized protein n=1 Tax=Araneus ventricosus TaxID=182803 RepID=A0A4Y2JD90_ARAVE|nr:hypothetical protein AVEN_16571-1 [Araneus ventricosus]